MNGQKGKIIHLACVLLFSLSCGQVQGNERDKNTAPPYSDEVAYGRGASPSYGADRSAVTFHMENDVLSDSDRFYTGGYSVHCNWLKGEEPKWAKKISLLPLADVKGEHSSLGFGLAQTSYTPNDIEQQPGPEDRPYAGYLRMSVSEDRVLSGNRADSFTLSLGVTGEPAGGQLQKWVHEKIRSRDPVGWGTQLETLPVVQVEYDRLWKFTPEPTKGYLDFIPRGGLELGNALVNAEAALMVRAGFNLPEDFGPRVMSASPASVSPPGQTYQLEEGRRDRAEWLSDGQRNSGNLYDEDKISCYLFAEAGARAVAWNLFLQGDNGIPDHDIDIEHLVPNYKVGLGIRMKKGEVLLQSIWSDQEFAQQGKPHRYGAVAIRCFLGKSRDK